ncbi:MAG TPA: (Fe-S)-binding protein [Syntrophomonadaceae bacterium]|nr:(Fe-S)-binding protein [Syntrophomonadaceae bacterium]
MQVSLFIPCTVDALLVDIGKDMVQIMAEVGFDLHYHKDQICCGQPALTAGYIEEAKKSAKRFIEIFEKDEYVVSVSGSCVNTVKNDYCKILVDEPGWLKRAEALSEKIFEFSQFMVDVAKITDVKAQFDGKVAYHHSCHLLRGLGVQEQPMEMLSAVKDIELVPLNGAEDCCGFGGQFALKYPYISEALVRDKVKNFIASGAEYLILADPGCLLNISGYLHRHHPDRTAMHLVSFLAKHMEKGVLNNESKSLVV